MPDCRRWKPGRVSAVAVGLLLLGLAVGACSPAPESIVAVEAAGEGGVRILTMTCTEFSPDDFGVYREGGPDELQTWAIVPRSWNGPAPSAVEVFRVPEGWKTYGSNIRSLLPDATYVADVHGDVNRWGISGEVRFGLKRLAKLGRGEVLTRNEDHETIAVSKKKFLDQANARCRELAQKKAPPRN
ncbi:hypothetical protein [Streptomyces sp. NPDC057052]|uniref:hypothetical protein n=1 Tax=Streptomyces sp. NPDC057052 TaxID=3346010 RepID=UPI00363AC925